MTKIFFASDIHGSEICFKKFLNAAKFYNVDILILGGDLTGKMVIPIVKSNGKYQTNLFNKMESVESREGLDALVKRIVNNGFYYYICDQDELNEIKKDKKKKDELFRNVILQSLRRWIETAEDRLQSKNLKCYIMAGNDDDPAVVDILNNSSVVINPDLKKVELTNDLEMISIGYSNLTPFNSPRELSESELENLISRLVKQVKNISTSIFNFHVPPYNSGLDRAPDLDGNLKVKSYSGQPKFVPVGSKAVRDAVTAYQPLLGLHGHVHESKGEINIGRTLCINPGSSYASGILQGVILEIENKKIKYHQFVNG